MRKTGLILLTAALAVMIAPGAYGIDVPLRFETSGNAGIPFALVSCPGMFSPIKKPYGNSKLPDFNQDILQKAFIRLGDKPILAVLDTRRKNDQYFSRLYIDRNCNDDLTDDPPIDGQVLKSRSGTLVGVEFPEIDVTLQVDGTPMPYRFILSIKMSINSTAALSGKSGLPFLYTSFCGYRGEFILGGTRYSVAICDGNGNGCFNDPASVNIPTSPTGLRTFPKGDVLFLRADNKTEIGNTLPLGNMLWLRDRLYWVTLDIPKGLMSFIEFSNNLVPVNFFMKPDILSLLEENSGRCVMIYRPSGETLLLPPGKYRLISYQVQRQDEKGTFWLLRASGTNESPSVTVQTKHEVSFPVGEPYAPFIVFPNLVEYGGIPKSISLALNLTGSGKELVTSLTVTGENKTGLSFIKKSKVTFPEEPAYTIVKPDGEIVARGSFEFG